MLEPNEECGEKSFSERQSISVALVLGVKIGLSNEELKQCHFYVSYSANPNIAL